MEHDNNRRPAERGRAAVTREKPRTPASRPRDSRPRTGSASTREAERRERMRSPEQTRTRSPEQTRSRDAAPARDRGTARQTRSAAAERQAPARDRAAAKAARKQADERKRQQAEQRKRQQAEQRKRRQAEQRQRQRTEEPEPEAAKKHRKKKPHRVYNTNFGFKFVTMLAVVAVIVLSMVIFFKVKHIEVVFTGVEPAVPVPLETTAPPVSEAASLASGETAPTGTGELPTGEGETAAPETALPETEAPETAQPTPPETAPALVEGHSCYTAGDIIEASGIHLDDNLLSLSKATVASRIHAALPYVNEIQIKIQFPGTVVITVSEFEVTYGIQDETGGWWLMSREGRILEAASEQAVRSHLVVTGMPIQVPQPGDWLKPSAADGADLSEIAAKQKVILEFIPALEQTPFAKEIVRVDVSTSYDLTLWYGTRYEIRLGTVEELDYKLRFLEAALEEKEIQRRSGTIDLTFNEDKKAHFMEFQ